MGKRIEDWIGQYRHMDWAVLYMRLFAGGMMLFHNIGKMQDYNEIVNSYPSFASAGSAATFVVVTVAEVLLAVRWRQRAPGCCFPRSFPCTSTISRRDWRSTEA